MKEETSRIGATKEEHGRLTTEIQRKDEALRHAEKKSREDSLRIEKLCRQIDNLQEDSRCIEALQQEREREKAKKRLPPMSDSDFLELCKSGYTRKVAEAIMNGANINARDNYGNTALMVAIWNGHTETAKLLRAYGAI